MERAAPERSRSAALGALVGLGSICRLFRGRLHPVLQTDGLGERHKGGDTRAGTALVFTLLPISIAYHVAHYFSYLVNGSQLVIPLLSDPFGFGWDLFRTAAYKPDIGFVGPTLQWYVAVGAIVVGHVIAVYLAHVKALTVFGARRVAVRSQIPIVVFMVGYTMLSLWIISQPIVETSPAA